jgi:large subunit ribosomal protein L25
MSSLNAQIRDAKSKGKQLRRAGIVPGVLFGKHLEESISVQIPKGEVELFLRHNAEGSKLDLVIDGKKHLALLKEVVYIPSDRSVEHLSFQAMKAGEKVSSVVHIHLHNKEKVDGIVQQSLNEIHYKAIPSKLVERIEIDLENKKVGESVMLSDLEFSKNPDVEILIPLDSPVYSITPRIAAVVEAPAAVEAAAEEEPAAEEKEET